MWSVSLSVTVFLVEVWSMFFTGATEVSLVQFPPEGRSSNKGYLDAGPNGLPNMTQFTLCLHLKLTHIAAKAPLVSYFAADTDNMLLVTVNVEEGTLSLECCGSLEMTVEMEVKMFLWQHLCVALDTSTLVTRVATNQQFSEKIINKTDLKLPDGSPARIVGGGRLVVGQDLDSAEGDFSYSQLVIGEIADFRLYDVVLPSEYLKAFANCEMMAAPHQPIIYVDENMEKLQPHGPTSVTSITLEDVCKKHYGYLQLFPGKRTLDGALFFCNSMKGTLVLPQSNEVNTEVYNTFLWSQDVCIGEWSTLYWVGTKGNYSTSLWMKLTGNTSITWDNFDPDWKIPTREYQCASTRGPNFPFIWFSIPCNFQLCALCNFTSHPLFRLRGLCKETLFDRSFSLIGYENLRPQFIGHEHSRVMWNNSNWVMVSPLYAGLLGVMMEESHEGYPLGSHIWTFHGDKCSSKKVRLLLTRCSSNKFTCNNGICIDKYRRCDLVTDCADYSDELNCNALVIPQGYSPDLPPPTLNTARLPVVISFGITSIRELNLLQFRVVAGLVITIKWRDSRLSYSNLHPDHQVNEVKPLEGMWRPKYRVKDGTGSAATTTIHNEAMFVIRESSPQPDDVTQKAEDEMYSGQENTVMNMQLLTLEFMCTFHLQMYPLDKQRCTFILTLTDKSAVFIKEDAGVVMKGERRLLEYDLIAENMTVYTENGWSRAKVELMFENLYGYYIGNTFVPSLMLVFICYLTYFFDLSDFQDRIMVSLTSLLVLATFFSQTSQSIPKTSYLKLVDVWYVALICQTFLMIVSLVIVENLRLMGKKTSITVVVPLPASLGSSVYKIPRDVNMAKRVNKLLQVVFLTTLLVLLVIFFGSTLL